jgi:hypothetical protein
VALVAILPSAATTPVSVSEPDRMAHEIRASAPRRAPTVAVHVPLSTVEAVAAATPAPALPDGRQVASSAVPSGDYPAEMVDAVCGQGLPWDCDTALWFAWAEMGRWYQPRAINYEQIAGNNAHGMFQIMLPLHSGYFDGDPLDPYVNARAAYGLWRDSGGTFCRHWFYWC